MILIISRKISPAVPSLSLLASSDKHQIHTRTHVQRLAFNVSLGWWLWECGVLADRLTDSLRRESEELKRVDEASDANQIWSIWNVKPEGASVGNNPFGGARKEPFRAFSAFLPQSSATMDRARNSLSLASVSLFLCSSVSPAWSIWLVNSLKILCISVK